MSSILTGLDPVLVILTWSYLRKDHGSKKNNLNILLSKSFFLWYARLLKENQETRRNGKVKFSRLFFRSKELSILFGFM